MADTKISQLPVASALTGSELVPVVQSGTTAQTTAQDIANLSNGGVVSVFGRNGAVVARSGDYSYGQISGTPVLAAVATSGAYSDLTGTPVLAAVATSGAYSDLTGTPTIPATTAFADVPVGTSSQYMRGDATLQTLATVATTGAYANLTGTPTIPTAASQISWQSAGTGSVARTVFTKIQDYAVSVLDFGADPTGVADSTAAIQAAITYAQTAASNTVYIPAGTYKISTALSITSPVALLGTGGKTILSPAAGIACININTANPVVLEKFSIIYSTPQTTGASLFAVNCTASSGTNSQSVFRDLLISGCDSAFQFTNTAFFIMDHVFVQNFVTAGVIMSNAVNVDVGDSIITNSTFFGSFGGSPATEGVRWLSSGGLRFENNKLGNLQFGVALVLASGAVTAQMLIIGNSFDTMTNAGILITRGGSGSGTFNSVIVSGNVFPDNNVGLNVPSDATGVWLTALTITGNTYVGSNVSTAVGFEIQSTQGATVNGNVLYSNNAATVGISVGSSASHVAVTSNALVGTFATTVVNSGTSSITANNT